MSSFKYGSALLGFLGGVFASLVAAVIFVPFDRPLRDYFSPPERRLSYYLTVQKMRDGNPYQQPFRSSGREILESGYKFKLNLQSRDPGYVYVFNEGLADNGRVYFNILYPTPLRNNESAEVVCGQQVETGDNTLGGKPDTEKLWIVWTKELESRVESAKGVALAGEGKVRGQHEEDQLRAFLEKHHSAGKPTELRDGTDTHTTVIGSGDAVVHLLLLEHR